MLVEYGVAAGRAGGGGGYGGSRGADWMGTAMADPTLLLAAGAVFALGVYFLFVR